MQPALTHILGFKDLVLGPIYFLILLLLVTRWKKKYYGDSALKKYILPSFLIKSISCLLLSFLYEYYYGYSDAHNYFTGATDVWQATKESPFLGLELVFKPLSSLSPRAQELVGYMSQPQFAESLVNMFKASGFIGMFCFGAYLPISLIISTLCLYGSWKIFLVFVEEFPAHYKKIALTCLFAPSFVFWGTNIMKDPFCIFGLGLCVNAAYNMIRGRFSFIFLLQLLFGAYVILLFKGYIFYTFCAAAFVALYVHLVDNASPKAKMMIRLLMLAGVFMIVSLLIIKRAAITEGISENFINEVSSIQQSQMQSGGSMYTLSNIENGSPLGILSTYLSSLNVALFRPYLWETPNIIGLANAVESFAVLCLTLYLLVKLKFIGFFRLISKNRLLSFALVFTLLLAPLAGLVSFNFGTLVRYKAPVVPFYYSLLMILYHQCKERKMAVDKA